MNRHQRCALQKEQHAFVKEQRLPDALTPVPHHEWPKVDPQPAQIWRSNKYLVQLWPQRNSMYAGLVRLSICRVKLNANGRWQDGLTWDELQAIKREVGYGDWYGVEAYPQDAEIVNVANYRHLWLLPQPLAIGWSSNSYQNEE